MKTMLVYGVGGHSTQMVELEKKLRVGEVVRVCGDDDEFIGMLLDKPMNRVMVPRGIKEGKAKTVLRSAMSLAGSLLLVSKERPNAIIAFGPGLAVPLCYCAKLFGAKVVFVETNARVYSRSTSGKLVYPIADLFLVQWEEMLDKYPRAVYAGVLQ